MGISCFHEDMHAHHDYLRDSLFCIAGVLRLFGEGQCADGSSSLSRAIPLSCKSADKRPPHPVQALANSILHGFLIMRCICFQCTMKSSRVCWLLVLCNTTILFAMYFFGVDFPLDAPPPHNTILASYENNPLVKSPCARNREMQGREK